MRPFLIAILLVGLGLACGGGDKEAREYETLPPVPPPTETSPSMQPATPAMPEPAPEPPRAMAPAQPAPMTAMTTGRFTVQVAAWKTRDKADKMVKWLEDRQYQAYVERINLPEMGVYYRVRIGPFATKAEAGAVGELLKGKYVVDYWIDNFKRRT